MTNEPPSSGIPLVEEKKNKYIARDIIRADHMRRVQHSTGKYLNIMIHEVDNKAIQNCPITKEGIKATKEIYGLSAPNLQGETVCRKVKHVKLVVV